jgi:hypothetical protein
MVINNWFEKSANYANVIARLGISQAEYLSLIKSVTKVFPQAWVSEELAKHDTMYPPVFRHDLLPGLFSRLQYNPIPMTLGWLCGGEIALVPLIRLGQLIQTVEGEMGAERLFKKLRGGPVDYMGARFEIEVLESFKDAGYSLKKAMETDGVDFTFEKNNREILVEATHRGASWILDLADKIFSRSFQRGFQGHSNRSVRLKLKYKIGYYTDVVVEKIVHKIVEASHGFSEGFDDPEGNYSIFVGKYENGNSLAIKWHDKGACVYEAIDSFKSKLQDERKLKQLLKNPGTYCAVDMRSLMPCILAGKDDAYNVSSKILRGWLSYTRQFFKENPDVGGVFIWVCHVGRVKDLIVDNMDQNEIILVNAPHHLSEEEALQLFPFAKLTKDLSWYHGNLDNSA